ncbi:hypothetical protein V5O48_012271 [Marasmius crinis-equi]|uniref:SBP-type domain-containing protein n=1 Tax=Marasmius crinis-equi TaxID=585013 RepID=A0ABR3F398_9AGAR
MEESKRNCSSCKGFKPIADFPKNRKTCLLCTVKHAKKPRKSSNKEKSNNSSNSTSVATPPAENSQEATETAALAPGDLDEQDLQRLVSLFQPIPLTNFLEKLEQSKERISSVQALVNIAEECKDEEDEDL